MELDDFDLVIAGGGVGGVAAAMAAADLGAQVALFEEGEWLGGQLTSQAVPSDEHGWLEQDGVGATRSYRQFRTALRRYYVDRRDLTATARDTHQLNPGQGRVSPICAEPRVIADVLDELVTDRTHRQRLQVFRGMRMVAIDVDDDVIRAITFVDKEGATRTVTCRYLIDASEEGDALPLAGCEYVTGAESQDQTGELHAIQGVAAPSDHQAITWCMALEHRPGENHTIDRPAQYPFWSEHRPAFWPDKLLSFTAPHPWTRDPRRWHLFGEDGTPSMWEFRRIRYGAHYAAATTDISIMNWPQNDYFLGNITDAPADVRATNLNQARNLSLSLLYWLQTEAPRADGGTGYPELRPCGDATGTADGLAQRPYIREGRRISALTTVTETDVGVEARRGQPTARQFPDSVGIGAYRIDLHPTTGGQNYVDISSYPFQIPLGALIPVRLQNLIAGAKNIGTTHITNGAYRVHPVEWNIGEAAGALAAFCLQRNRKPHQVHQSPAILEEFQGVLGTALHIELVWPERYRQQPL